MNFLKRSFFLYLVPFLPLLWDGHFSFILSHYLPDSVNVTTHLFLMSVFSAVCFLKKTYSFLFLLPYGFIYDSYYFNAIGITLLTLPILFHLLSLVIKFVQMNTYGELTLFFLFMVFFDCLNFGLGYLYGLTNYPVSDFIVYQLAPTLFVNMLIFVVLRKPLIRLLSVLSVDRIK